MLVKNKEMVKLGRKLKEMSDVNEFKFAYMCKKNEQIFKDMDKVIIEMSKPHEKQDDFDKAKDELILKYS